MLLKLIELLALIEFKTRNFDNMGAEISENKCTLFSHSESADSEVTGFLLTFDYKEGCIPRILKLLNGYSIFSFHTHILFHK